MINNKGYVFTSMLLLFIFFISFIVVLFKQDLSSSVIQASYLQGVIDRIELNHSNTVDSLVNDLKLTVFGNLSNSSLVSDYNDSVGGIIIDNYPSFSLTVEDAFYSIEEVNLTMPETVVPVVIDYPISDLLAAELLFNEQTIQQCLDNNQCSDNRGTVDSILTSCLTTVGGFSVQNSSVPLLIGSDLIVDLSLIRERATLLFPFWLGSFTFDC